MTPCEKQVTLKPGDYIATADLSGSDYHAVARAFMAAGCGIGEYPRWDYAKDGYLSEFGWSLEGLWHSDYTRRHCNGRTRQLTLTQILGATNAGGQEEKVMTNDQWVPEVGEECEIAIDGLDFIEGKALAYHDDMVWIDYGGRHPVRPLSACKFRPLPTEEDRAVEEMMQAIAERNEGRRPALEYPVEIMLRMLYQDGYRKQPQPAEDMADPANWRAGDVLMALEHGSDISKEGEYEIIGFDSEGDPIIKDDAGDTQGSCARNFRFVRRP